MLLNRDQRCGPAQILLLLALVAFSVATSCNTDTNKKIDEIDNDSVPLARLVATDTFLFNSFVDCNMATVWVGDTFKIFPGKYGEDPLWGESHELKFAAGSSVDAVFASPAASFKEPVMPPNVKPGKEGLHGAVWFEALYKDPKDKAEKTLFALYHNENYPSTLPYDSVSGKGYIDNRWPQGLKGPGTKTAVCRIGIMQSADGGYSWSDRGIVLEDHQPRLILEPHNTAINFAGGVGDPSAVASGEFLYIFFGEYGYPQAYDSSSYDPAIEWSGQCISMARIRLDELSNPVAKAKRWDGKSFNAPQDGAGLPIASLQIARDSGGGPASSPTGKYFWGPSVSWNNYLQCWVMMMAKAEGPSWKGNSIYISYNRNKDLGAGFNSQQWSKPVKLLDRPGHIIWYPSLQPVNSAEDKEKRYTSVNLGQNVRLFFKDMYNDKSVYTSEYIINFKKEKVKDH